MANILLKLIKHKKTGNIYDICDAAARSDIQTLIGIMYI